MGGGKLISFPLLPPTPQEEHKAKTVQVPQVPGIDFKLKVLFTKVSLCVAMMYLYSIDHYY